MILEGKVAFVTGSTRGIGWAIAEVFVDHGATVVINGHSDKVVLDERLNSLKTRSNNDHGAILTDVSDEQSIKQCYNWIYSKYKKLDILVNNAGIMEDSLIGMVSPQLIQKTFEVNVFGVINNLQYASRLMTRKKTGSIINLSSIIGRLGNTGQVVYGSSKSAVIGITLSAAKELAANLIRVNAIAPGFIETDMTKKLPKAKYDALVSSIKMGRIGYPKDIANTALFFASDYSQYITGQVLGVDGGMLI